MDRRVTMETLDKMKQPKTYEHKRKISHSVRKWWIDKKQEDIRHGITKV